MRGYLETMNVSELAIEAHEKGEADHDTINIIEFDDHYFKIKKQSRITDLGLELPLGKEFKQTLPGDRVKTILATTDNPGKAVKIVSTMPTMNGIATVVDTKTLTREESGILVLVQTLVVRNEKTGKEHVSVIYYYSFFIITQCGKLKLGSYHVPIVNVPQTTVRYFNPHHGEISPVAITAKGTIGTGLRPMI